MNKCIVVGGGLIGMLSAHALLKKGYKITVIERGPFGREASWAGGGILSPLYPWRYANAVNDLAAHSQVIYPELVEEVHEIAGIDPEFRRTGILMLDVHDLELAQHWAEDYAVDLKVPNLQESSQIEAALSPKSIENAVWMQNVAQIRNPRFIKAMQQYLTRNNVDLYADTEVAEICTEQQQVVGVKTLQGDYHAADKVVIANGAWSSKLLRQTHIDLAIKPVRGQMILYKAEPGLLQGIILKNNRYLIPRADGYIVVGSTIESVGFDKSTTDEALAELKQFAEALVPDLAGYLVEKHWAGLRPGCGEGIPYIGEHPQIAGLYVNAGHFRNGIVMGPAAAALLADLVVSQAPLIDPSPYALHHSRGGILTA